ncbi:DUF4190 domain-containing protein [Glaciibacter superstes]|uniref:DUF4190 domain-containing protein n=1 Tax=Glaciibacter superstes TaxID=501023 RepID=UPI0003B4B016|nr:DUF4190 domain-containing protein [Glaciibacter superstes]
MSESAAVPTTSAAATEAPWNVLSIVGFVLSLVGFNVIAVILGFIGLSQVKKTGERGRGFAIAAIIIGLASAILFIILFIALGVVAASGAIVTTN